MKPLRIAIAAGLGIALVLSLAPREADAQIAVRGDVVHTVAGPDITDGVVLVRDGRIERVGQAGEVAIPDGYRVMQAAVVTPGLVDVRGTVGLSGILNVDHDQDVLETSSPIQPELRAVDAYNPREELVAFVRELGVTTVNTGHAPGALVSGQTAVVKTRGNTVDQALMVPLSGVTMTLGPSVGRNFDRPGTRSAGVAMLRQELIRGREYANREDNGSRDLRREVLAQVMTGEVPAVITAHRTTEILTALRLAEELGFRLILDGASEAYLVADRIAEARVPVLLHPTMIRPGGEAEHASFQTAQVLRDAGVLFAIQSGYEPYVPKTRVVLFEAAVAAANGLGPQAALRAITLNPARILGIDDRVGSIEAGKDADLVLFDGDPFEYVTRVCGVLIDGEVVSESCR
jgi:imidazolonepropionase-like amidohydrolase